MEINTKALAEKLNIEEKKVPALFAQLESIDKSFHGRFKVGLAEVIVAVLEQIPDEQVGNAD